MSGIETEKQKGPKDADTTYRIYDAFYTPLQGSKIYYDVSSESEAIRLLTFLRKISTHQWVMGAIPSNTGVKCQ